MRGQQDHQEFLFTTISPERRVPQNHPLRSIKRFADEVLAGMSKRFDKMYSDRGRESIPPERLLKAQLLIALYSVRSDRLFCEMLDYNILFRWFLDMDLEQAPMDHSTFSLNRERLIENDIAREFFNRVVNLARSKRLLSDEHFTVDGTLIGSWASLKSFKEKGAKKDDDSDDDPKNPTVNFHGEKRTNETHESSTDPEAKLLRKGPGKEARLSFGLHLLMENRNGLCVDMEVNDGTGRAELKGAKKVIKRYLKKIGAMTTIAGDKGYHNKRFVRFLRKRDIRPHIAQVTNRHVEGLDARTTRHQGYEISQRKRKLIEENFGWFKTIGGLRKSRFVGIVRNELHALITGSAYNLLRISRLTAAPS